MRKIKFKVTAIGLLIFGTIGLFFLIVGYSTAHAQNYSVTLTILNPPNSAGEIVLVAGDNIEVEFNISDPNGELSKDDKIRLTRISDGKKISEKKRGNNLIGSVSLKTEKEEGAALVTCSAGAVYNYIVENLNANIVTCTHSFPSGSIVTLNSLGTNFTGDCSGTDACTVTMDGPKTITGTH